MKYLLSASTFLAAAVPGLLASPLLPLGDAARIFGTLDASAEYRSNVTLSSSNEIDDFVWVVTPGLDLVIGTPGSNVDITLFARYGIVRFIDSSEFDTERADIGGRLSYGGRQKLVLNLDLGYRESEDFEADVNRGRQVIEIEEYYVDAEFEYPISPKTSFGLGGNYLDRSYDNNVFNRDRTQWSVPVAVYHELTPKYDGFLEFSYGETEIERTRRVIADGEDAVSDGQTYEDYIVNAGVRGELLPKIKGNFRVGYRQREYDSSSRSSDSGINVRFDATYSIDPVSLFKLGLFSRFGAGGGGSSTEQYGINGIYSRMISDQIRLTGFGRYTFTEYLLIDREDDNFQFGLNGEYTYNRHVTFLGGYTLRVNSSTLDFQDYDGHFLSVGVSVRY